MLPIWNFLITINNEIIINVFDLGFDEVYILHIIGEKDHKGVHVMRTKHAINIEGGTYIQR